MRHTFGIDHIALLVRDVAASVRFYTEIFGFEPITREGSPNVRWLTIGGLDTIHLIEGDFGNTFLTKDTHVALRVENFDAFVDALRATGLPFCDWPGTPGQVGLRKDGFRQVYIQDPDGYWIEINDHTRDIA